MHASKYISVKSIVVVLIIQLFVLESFSQNPVNTKKTSDYYNNIIIKNDIAKLNFFFSMMPKGGDLHHHYSGAQYVETYLDWAKEKNLKINFNTFKIDDNLKDSLITVDQLRANSDLHRALISLWSDQDFYNHVSLQVPPDQHFFNSFSYFSILCAGNDSAGFQILKKRAITENVQYIETMFSSVDINANLSQFDEQLLIAQASKSQEEVTKIFKNMLDTIDEKLVLLGLKNYFNRLNSAQKGIDDKQFTMRYQAYASRNSAASKVFVSLYGAFRACIENDYVVGVNLVGPENGPVAMRDYWLHMQMFKFLKSQKQFEKVNIALHAGELAMGLVRPEDLSYHINDAINIAGATRIGHGIDMPYEKNAINLIRSMAKNQNVVEINLTSNEFILGIKGNQHPIRLYYDAGVPIVISTDDAGVSRNNLSNEYMLLASRYKFSYEEIKNLVANSINYSFLPKETKIKQLELLQKRFVNFETQVGEFLSH